MFDSRYLAARVARRIGFDALVAGLARHGTAFDPHFELQTRILCIDAVPYDTILRQETLDADLRAVYAATGLADPFPQGLPRRNPSLALTRAKIEPGAETLAAIRQIYAPDFEQLGYD